MGKVSMKQVQSKITSDAGLRILLDRSESSERRTSASATIVGPLDEDAISQLLELLENGDEGEAFDVAAVFSASRSKKVTRALLRSLRRARAEHTKLAAIHTLQRLRDSRAVRGLAHVASSASTSEQVRAKACDALSSFARKPYVLRVLLSGLRDPSANIRYHCVVALSSEIADPRVRQEFHKLKRDMADTWEGVATGDVVPRLLSRPVDPSSG